MSGHTSSLSTQSWQSGDINAPTYFENIIIPVINASSGEEAEVHNLFNLTAANQWNCS